MSNTEQDKAAATQMRVRPETRAKIQAIAERQRWTLVETIDAIADEFMAAHKIELGGKREVKASAPAAA